MSEIPLHEIIITARIGNGYAFAASDALEGSIFISAKIAKAADVRAGEQYLAVIERNKVMPERTAWYAQRVFPSDSVAEQRREDLAVAQRCLREIGGVWTPQELAERMGGPEDTRLARAIAAAEHQYSSVGGVTKFVRFDGPFTGGSQTWYTCSPEDADVAEWDAEEDAE